MDSHVAKTRTSKTQPFSHRFKLAALALIALMCSAAPGALAQTVVEMEDYNRFYDTSAGNSGNTYRTDDVDIEAASVGGYNVGWTETGEWFEFDINLAEGNYELTAQVASANGPGAYTVLLDGQIIATDSAGVTGGWQTWVVHTLDNVTVETSGAHTLKLQLDSGALNIDWLTFTPIATVDSDGDGVPDGTDTCPGTPNGVAVDNMGCPQASSYSSSSSSSSSTLPTLTSLLTSTGNFTSGKEDFTTYFNVAGSVSADYNGEASFAITSVTTQAWHIQFMHAIDVNAGNQYSICFDAKASSARTIAVEVDDNAPSYASLRGGVESVSLISSYQSFKHTFVATASVTDARLVFNLGLDDADVQLDNIAFVVGDSCTVSVIQDTDADGVEDSQDQCPATPSDVSVNSQGCPLDADNDGVPDYLDNCANTVSGANVDSNGCENIEDDDADGVSNSLDQCPATPTGDTVDSQGCSVVVIQDTDSDGIADANDQCPNTPANETANTSGFK